LRDKERKKERKKRQRTAIIIREDKWINSRRKRRNIRGKLADIRQ